MTKKDIKYRKVSLFVDCQILQTAAYDRGMGKYTLNLLKAFLNTEEATDYDEICVIFNSNLPLDDRFEDIERFIGERRFSIASLDLPTDMSTEGFAQQRNEAKKSITTYIHSKLSSDNKGHYLLMAPFFVGYPAVFPDVESVVKFSIVYDITPQKIWHLQKIFPDDMYFSHYSLLAEADHLFTISNAVKDDLANLVGISREKVTSIDGGPMVAINKKEEGRTQAMIGFQSPYILHVTAPIVHKNNERAIEAFRIFNARNDDKYTLYITSSFNEESRHSLEKIDSTIRFTGNITDKELVKAYKGADVLLFSSLAEGLGMPVLEAGMYDIPVACSEIPVLSELGAGGFYMFDPTDTGDMAEKIEMAAKRIEWEERKKNIEHMVEKYTWRRSARLMDDVLASYFNDSNTYPCKSRKSVRITMPSPRLYTPGARLGDMLYMHLLSVGYRPSIESVDILPRGKKQGIGISLYNEVARRGNEQPDVEIQIRDRRGWLSTRRRVDIIAGDHTFSLDTEACVEERALGIAGWEYIPIKASRFKKNVLNAYDVCVMIEKIV